MGLGTLTVLPQLLVQVGEIRQVASCGERQPRTPPALNLPVQADPSICRIHHLRIVSSRRHTYHPNKRTRVGLLKRVWVRLLALVCDKHVPPSRNELRPSLRH